MPSKKPAVKGDEIATHQDFLKVPAARWDDCLEDFKMFLAVKRPLAALFEFATALAEEDDYLTG